MTWTEDGFLGGKLKIRQPRKGFRAGSDAVLLGSAINIQPGETLLDVGCGVGTAGLCTKFRVPEIKLWGIELQGELADAAHQNSVFNCLDEETIILSKDITRRADFKEITGPTGRRFLNDTFDHVITNPPFYEDGRAQASPSEIKSQAHIEGTADLAYWIAFCTARVKPRGQFTLIHRSDRLPEILHEMEKGCGSLKIIPLWPNTETPAKRILVQGIKSDHGPTLLHPGIVLHEKNGQPTEISESILRGGASLIPFIN